MTLAFGCDVVSEIEIYVMNCIFYEIHFRWKFSRRALFIRDRHDVTTGMGVAKPIRQQCINSIFQIKFKHK